MDAQHDLPTEPEARHISPTPADYAKPVQTTHVLWPSLWLGIALGLFLLVRAMGWPGFGGH